MSFVITRKTGLKSQLTTKTSKHRQLQAGRMKAAAGAAMALTNDLAPKLEITMRAIADLQAATRRTRKPTEQQISATALSITTFGFVSPITVRGNQIFDGHVRVQAAHRLGMFEVPCIDISHLSDAKARMLAISLNRLAETGTWDPQELKLELSELKIEGFELTISGFSSQELDILLLEEPDAEPKDETVIPEPPLVPVSRVGDLWELGGRHRILCGNSLAPEAYGRLLEGQLATAVLADAPYNVKIANNVSGLGKKKHGEFKMGSGEMSQPQFQEFLATAHKNCSDHLISGGVAFSFMDWRSFHILVAAGQQAGLHLVNTVVWYKGSGSMGAFYRSAHEMVGVFCKGASPAINNIQLGKHGRDRTNVWVYPGANKPGSSAAAALKHHPSPKNVEMCVDAILDVTHSGHIVLDPFLGSGTTVIAAEKSGRCGYGIELDPGYVDVAVSRWEALTGEHAIHAETGRSFAEIAKERAEEDIGEAA